METLKMTTKLAIATAMIALTFVTQASYAEVTAEEAAKLKSTLTPFGAEKAGNSNGTIPAWAGGYTTVSPGYKNGAPRPDPFASDKPLFSITAKNMDQYAASLSDGVKAMLKKDPKYRLDIYPTHRSAAAPKWVYDNTFKNATRAKLTDNGYGVEGAYGGIPFPIPKDGYEALWNHRLAWNGHAFQTPSTTWVVMPDGNRILASRGQETHQYPYYDKDGSLETFKGHYLFIRYIANAPASKAGESILAHEPTNATQPRMIWQYLVGQRRVRRAPSVAYDTPDSVTSGMGMFDEAFGMFGPSDRHQWTLVGKKELYLPYNNNRAALAKVADLITPGFLNPDLVRWELHRVWVLEAKLAPGKRHVMPTRKYYLDEDTWQIVLQDGWDAQGQLWHTQYNLPYLVPDLPAVVTSIMWGVYNHQTGTYYYNLAPNEESVVYNVRPNLKDNDFSPEALASQGAR
jgi:hypothetical protein